MVQLIKVKKIQRSTVVIDPKGKIIQMWKTVKQPQSHPNDVLSFIQSAQH